jgi:hypothetical protein
VAVVVQAHHNLGMLLAQEGRLDEGRGGVRGGARERPGPRLGVRARSAARAAGRWARRDRGAGRCVAEQPDYPRARYNLALAYAKSGDNRRRSTGSSARRADDTHREAVLTLIDLARQTNDKQRLERWVLEAARLDPDVRENPGLGTSSSRRPELFRLVRRLPRGRRASGRRAVRRASAAVPARSPCRRPCVRPRASGRRPWKAAVPRRFRCDAFAHARASWNRRGVGTHAAWSISAVVVARARRWRRARGDGGVVAERLD